MERNARTARRLRHIHVLPSAAVSVLTPQIVPSDALVAKQSTVMAHLPDAAPLSPAEATAAALALPNRGPLSFDADGRVPQHVLDAFEALGFYVFEGVIGQAELSELQDDFHECIDGLDAAKQRGEETFESPSGVPIAVSSFGYRTPLSDNSNPEGRSPVPMQDYAPPADAPEQICSGASYYLRFSEPGVRLYGHPGLLAVAEAVNGKGFTPFSDSLQLKKARLGPAVAWHQDGTTHWEAHGAEAEHGFNFMAQLHGSTAENAVWAVPGSHRWGHLDIPQIVGQHGERIPGALPMITSPGDVVICNRNALHCSYPNTSDRERVTLNFGFHRRSAVDAAKIGENALEIDRRCRAIPLAVAARAARFPEEVPFEYDLGQRETWTGLGPEESDRFANCFIGL